MSFLCMVPIAMREVTADHSSQLFSGLFSNLLLQYHEKNISFFTITCDLDMHYQHQMQYLCTKPIFSSQFKVLAESITSMCLLLY